MLSAQRSARRIDWFQGKFTIVPCILPHRVADYRTLNRWILLSQFSLIHPPEKRPERSGRDNGCGVGKVLAGSAGTSTMRVGTRFILTWAVQPRRERLITRWGAMKLLIPGLCTLDNLEIVSYYAMLSTMMDSTMPRITKLFDFFFFFNLEKIFK